MKFLSLCALLLLAGCAAQIEQKMKTAVLLSPESQGESRISAGAGYQSAPMVTITENVKRTPPDRSRTIIEQQERIMLHGAAGVTDWLDLHLDPASWLNAKAQLVGEPFTRAAKGNISLSVLGSIWLENDKGESDSFNAANQPDVSYEKKAVALRAGLLAGYRVTDLLLLYGGVTHQRHRYHGTYDILGGAKGSFAGFATANSVNLGFEVSLNKDFVIRLEDAYSIAKVKAFGAKSSQHSVGLLLAGMFGK
jgi:hypothetical protein